MLTQKISEPDFNIGFSALKLIFNHIENGVTVTDADSRIVYVNPAFTKITGYTVEEVLFDTPGVLHSGKHDAIFYEKMWSDLNKIGAWEGEIWNRNKSGAVYPEYLTISKINLPQHEQFYYVAIFNDISYLKEDQLKQYQLAFYDPLTLLPNRHLLKDRFAQNEERLKRCQHSGKSDENMAVLFIDLNKFKMVNDTHGHLVGDGLLQHVGNVLQACSRKIDTVCRYGGDEFVILLPHIKQKKDIEDYCQRAIHQLKQPCQINDIELVASLSVGVCFYPAQADSFDEAIQLADQAMYHAKQNQLGVYFQQ